MVCTRRTNSARTFTEALNRAGLTTTVHLGLLPGACEHGTSKKHAHQRGISWEFMGISVRTDFPFRELIHPATRISRSLVLGFSHLPRRWFSMSCFSRAHHPCTPPIPATRMPPSPIGLPQRAGISPRGAHLKANRLTGRSTLHPYPAQTCNLFSQCSENNPFPLEENQLLEIPSTGNDSVQK